MLLPINLLLRVLATLQPIAVGFCFWVCRFRTQNQSHADGLCIRVSVSSSVYSVSHPLPDNLFRLISPVAQNGSPTVDSLLLHGAPNSVDAVSGARDCLCMVLLNSFCIVLLVQLMQF